MANSDKYLKPYFRFGIILLTLWAVANLMVAAYIVVLMGIFGANAPSLYVALEKMEILTLNYKAIKLINCLAILANATIVSYCVLILAVIWKALVKKQEWAFWALLTSMGFVQILGFVSDGYIGNKFIVFNLLSTIVLIIGMGLVKLQMDER